MAYNRTVDFSKLSQELNRLSRTVQSWNPIFKKTVDSALAEVGNTIRTRIIKSMQQTKKASWFYMRGKKKHHPSAPGSPPAIDSGELIRSILFDHGFMKIEIGADMGAPYAEVLETGNKKGTLKARPWLQPAVDAETPGAIDLLIKRIKENI